jgi:hypothetical protein
MSGRPRGFVDWHPAGKTRLVLDQVQAVLAEYAAHLPLTIRQIFYRLVGAYDFPKLENDYKRLCRILSSARRDQTIPMDAIRDDGGTVLEPFSFAGEDDFFQYVRNIVDDFLLDRTKGQKSRLVVMCEAAGMAPQLERVASPYGIAVRTGGGFDSLTDKYNFAREVAAEDRPVEVLHIGDYDPSGTSIFDALAEDVRAFCDDIGGEPTFTRLAVTPAQIRRYQLPTAPPKASDKRSGFTDTQTCQAEALPPDILATILRTAITARLDERLQARAAGRESSAARNSGATDMTNDDLVLMHEKVAAALAACRCALAECKAAPIDSFAFADAVAEFKAAAAIYEAAIAELETLMSRRDLPIKS